MSYFVETDPPNKSNTMYNFHLVSGNFLVKWGESHKEHAHMINTNYGYRGFARFPCSVGSISSPDKDFVQPVYPYTMRMPGLFPKYFSEKKAQSLMLESFSHDRRFKHVVVIGFADDSSFSRLH